MSACSGPGPLAPTQTNTASPGHSSPGRQPADSLVDPGNTNPPSATVAPPSDLSLRLLLGAHAPVTISEALHLLGIDDHSGCSWLRSTRLVRTLPTGNEVVLWGDVVKAMRGHTGPVRGLRSAATLLGVGRRKLAGVIAQQPDHLRPANDGTADTPRWWWHDAEACLAWWHDLHAAPALPRPKRRHPVAPKATRTLEGSLEDALAGI